MDDLVSSGKWSTLEPAYDRLILSDVPLLRFDSHLDSLLEKTYKRLCMESYEPLKLINIKTTQEERDQLDARHRDLLEKAEAYNQANNGLEKQEELDELLGDADRSIEGLKPEPAISMDFIKGFDNELTPIQRKEFEHLQSVK